MGDNPQDHDIDAYAASQFWAQVRRRINEIYQYAEDHLPDHPDAMDERAREETLAALRETRMMADAHRSAYLAVAEDQQAAQQAIYQQQVQQGTPQQMWEAQTQAAPQPVQQQAPQVPYTPSHGRTAAQAPRPGAASPANPAEFSRSGW